MLCSRCSSTVKPVVAIDIDGTLGDYHGHFWDFARSWLGVEVPDGTDIYRGDEPYRDWFRRSYGVDVTTFRSIKLAYRQGGMKRTMPVFPGAWEITHTLRRIGAEVWLTTTRPHDRYDRVDPDTREWLSRNHIEFDGLIYEDDKYRVLAERVDTSRVVGCLDDEFGQLMDFELLFESGVALLARNDYNTDVSIDTDCANLHVAKLVLVEAVEQWERNNG